MSTPELESDHYDAVVLGTGLAESIAAASLAKAGKTVLHLDPNEYYGGEQASLTLDELGQWAEHHASSESESESESESSANGVRYSSASTSTLTSELEKDKRRFAISLFPSVLPSRGKLIDTLITSDVSKYVSFRLLDSISVFEQGREQEQAGPGPGLERGTAKRVPGSKEEVFKDKSVGLLDKRRLMKFLMFASSEFEGDDLLKGKDTLPLLQFLQESFSIPPGLATSITYAISHCSSPEDQTLPALVRTRRYLRSVGRYGPGAFLVGQYGGAGEVAQGFCRACAVFGGTYVLGPSAKPTSIESTSDGISIQIPCHPRPVTASHIVSSPNHLPPSLIPAPLSPAADAAAPTGLTAHGIFVSSTLPEPLRRTPARAPVTSSPDEGEAGTKDAVADVENEPVENDDTALIVFPPHGGHPLVRCYVNGEGTGSCPAGQYVIYLSASVDKTTSPSELLRPYLGKMGVEPSFEAYYISHRPLAPSSTIPTASDSNTGSSPEPQRTPVVLLAPYAGEHLLTEGLDHEAAQGEAAYNAIVQDKAFFEKDVSEEEEMGIGEE